MSDQANIDTALTPTDEQPQESYLSSAYRLVSDAIYGASSVAQDTAADASAAAQDTASTAVQSVYDSAPAVLPGSTIDSSVEQKKQQQENREGEAAAAPKTEAERREARIEETKAAGPSDESRVGKTQQEIGTETGIPTSAGPGTTLSPDAKALEAASPNNGRAAHVPQDYTNEPCPSNFVTGKTPESAVQPNGAAVAEEATASSTSTSTTPAGQEDTTSETNARSKKTAFGDKLKGNAKILSGKLGRNHDKVELGKSIKRGD